MTNLHRLSRDAAQPNVGRDVEAFCTPCALALTHTILAMVGREIAKVKCNTCGAEHKYRSAREAASAAAAPAKGKRAPTARAKAAQAAAGNTTRVLFQRAMADRDRADAIAYTPALAVKPGMLVDHRTFGHGIVDAVYEGKSRLLFEDGYKILVTGR